MNFKGKSESFVLFVLLASVNAFQLTFETPCLNASVTVEEEFVNRNTLLLIVKYISSEICLTAIGKVNVEVEVANF